MTTFLRESNAIENEFSDAALEDSVLAWNYALENYDNWGVDYVCGVHSELIKNLNPKIAGKLRRKNVYIVERDFCGNKRIIREIEAKGNKDRLRKWFKEYYDLKNLDKMLNAHIDFEMIHPFIDGNGRTGRILYNAQRVNAGFGVEVFYEKDKQDYYKLFTDRQNELTLKELMKNPLV